MTPEKKRAAMVRGISKLYPRICVLKTELCKLEAAELFLIKEKWAAEREMTEVKIIPLGMSAKKAAVEAKSFEDQVSSMSAERAAELLAMLEARLGGD